VGLGYFEVRTSAFMDRGDPDRLHLTDDDERRRHVRVRNPIVVSLDTMRTSLIPGMLRVLRHNVRHGAESLRLAQIDRVFIDQPGSEDGLAREPEKLLAVAYGARHPSGWAESHKPCDLYDIKGDAEASLEQLGVDSVWSAGYTEPFLDSTASFLISGSYGTIGGGGAVNAAVLRGFGIEAPVFVLELDVEALEKHLPGNRAYRGIARFPVVKRDLSLVVPRRVQYREVRDAVVESGGSLLESVECFDVFEDPSLGDDAHSIGVRLRFRSAEKTLTDEDVDPTIERMVRRLAKQYEVQLRAE
jgi:phenylalanyl-tRNA synthetase beta chain